MLRSAWFIALKDVQYLLLKRETILWTFVMPVIFFYFIGTITGGFRGGLPVVESTALKVPANAGFLADEFTRRLEASGYQIVLADTIDNFDAYTRQIVVPEHFTDSVLAGRQAAVEFRRRGEGIAQEYDAFRVERATYSVIADMIVSDARGDSVTARSFAAVHALPRTILLDVEQAGNRTEIPSGFSQAIPGTMVMFTLLILLSSGAVMLVVERREGLLRRLAAAPMTREAIVLGKWGGRMILAAVQVGFAMLLGTLLFKMDWGPSLGMVLVLMLVYAGFNAVLGILLGSIAKTEGQAVGIGVLSANVLAALGGCWWPIEVTPDWMQRLALFLPTGVAMDAMHKLVNFQLPAAAAIPHVAVLAVAGLIVGAIAAKVFRFQ